MTSFTKTIAQRAVERFEADGFEDGDVLSMDWILWALDIKTPHSLDAVQEQRLLLLDRLDVFRNILLREKKIALQNLCGGGYRVVPPDEQAQYAATEGLKLVKKGISKARSLIENTRIDRLTNDERRRHTDAAIKIAALDGMMRKGRRDVLIAFQGRALMKAK